MAKIPKLKGNKKYKDAPRYKLIYDYEGNFKQAHKETLDKMLKELGGKLKSIKGK